MSETTEGKSIPEALRMIAEWIEKGIDLQWRQAAWPPECQWADSDRRGFYPNSHIYRAKPRKPLTALHLFGTKRDCEEVEVVELTPEVRAALEEKGLMP